ncbi:MAG: hypothetical protein Kow0077_07420 [Anaerolineae bacterium]
MVRKMDNNLKTWDNTRSALHKVAEVLGAVRRVFAQPEPNWVHLGIEIDGQTMATGKLPMGEFVFRSDDLVFAFSGDETHREIPVAGKTQQELVRFVEAVLQRAGHAVKLDESKLHGEDVINITAEEAHEFLSTMRFARQVLARLHADLDGYKTRLVLWPHGFDLAFLWFEDESASDEAKDQHIGIGFSPGSPGLAAPYFYLYLWPMPEGLSGTSLPAPARWHSDGWTGVVIDLASVGEDHGRDTRVLAALKGAFETLIAGIS